MTIKEVASILEEFAPLLYQESYDNSGLTIGNSNNNVSSVLLTVDVTEEVIDEAINKKANLVIAHHPIIFKGIKSITGKNYVEKIVAKAIKNDIAIYAAHTNMDGVWGGVNTKLGEKLGLLNIKILSPKKGELRKLVTFVPDEHSDKLRKAIFDAGAGNIGFYDQCSFNLHGNGSFRAGENSKPYKGERGELHFEKEIRIETIFPKHLERSIVNALLSSHPYEEVAYDIYPLDNEFIKAGMGAIGELPENVEEEVFLADLKKIFNLKCIRHSSLLGKKVKRIAVCGGTGAFLLKKAISSGADAFLTADIKYHEYFDADKKILFVDIGHYESEQVIKDIFYELLTKNNLTFAIHFSETITNPVNYY